jgi:hypothetical protein
MTDWLASVNRNPPQQEGQKLMAQVLQQLPPAVRDQLVAEADLQSERDTGWPSPTLALPVTSLDGETRELIQRVLEQTEREILSVRQPSPSAPSFLPFHDLDQQMIGFVSPIGYNLGLNLLDKRSGKQFWLSSCRAPLHPDPGILQDLKGLQSLDARPGSSPARPYPGRPTAALQQLATMQNESLWPPQPLPPLWEQRTLSMVLPPEKRRPRSPEDGRVGRLSDLIDLLRTQGLTILADHYSRPPKSWALREGKLAEVLREIERVFQVEGHFDGDILLLRHRGWPEWDRAEVPNRLLRRWEAQNPRRGVETRGDSLDLLAEIVTSLNDEQLASGLYWAKPGPLEGFGSELKEIDRLKSFLHFYAALSPPQQLQVRGDGLALNELTGAQLQLLRKAGLWPGTRAVAVHASRDSSVVGPVHTVIYY